jgi:hypothetical protein
MDVGFDALDQLRGHFADAVFPGVLSRSLEYLLYRLTPYDVLTPTRRVNLGAFQDLCHGFASLSYNIHDYHLMAVDIVHWMLIYTLSHPTSLSAELR